MRRSDALVPRHDRDRVLTVRLRRELVINTAELTSYGFSPTEIRGLVTHGDLLRLHRGVYVDGRSAPTPWCRLKAGLLAAGPDAFLSHASAAAARRYRPINPRDIHVTVVATSTPQIAGITVHRSAPPGPGEVSIDRGVRVATLPRILLDLAATGPEAELAELITAGERRGSLEAVAEILARHPRRRGSGRLRGLLAGHLRTELYNSGFERAFWTWFATQADLPPPDVTNLRVGPYEFDGVWYAQALVLELDGRAYHQARADIERDRAKDAYVQRRGMRILRVTDTRFELDRGGVHDDLRAFLRQAA